MKMMIVVTLALVAAVSALPVDEPPKILRSKYEQEPEGGYAFDFETENGITREEKGLLKEAFDEDNKPHLVVVVRGSYTYTNDEGVPETISYYADETGYHAEGVSIPQVASRR